MKTYNTPGQARNLREIEAAAAAPVIRNIKAVNGTVQPAPAAVQKEEEAGAEAQAEVPSKKARSKKKAETV